MNYISQTGAAAGVPAVQAPVSNVVSFKGAYGLEHTSALTGWLSYINTFILYSNLPLPHYDDDVLHSPAVDQCVGYALASSSVASCNTSSSSAPSSASAAQAAAQGPPNETQQELDERRKHPPTEAPERMAIAKVPQDVPVATPLYLTVNLAPGKLVSHNLFGSIYVTEIGPSGEGVEQGTGPAKIVRDDGTTKVIEVMPAQLGQVTFRIGALYADNAVATQTIHVNVIPTAKNLRNFGLGYAGTLSLVLDNPGHHETARVAGRTPMGARWLSPQLVYGGDHPLTIYADGAQAIHLTVEQPEDAPVIRLDKNGLVHPLRVGKAVIVGEIDGIQTRLNVAVYATQDDAPNILLSRPGKDPQ